MWWKVAYGIVAWAAISALTGGAALGSHVAVTVDCDLGESINSKIDAKIGDEFPDQLTFKGTCTEAVVIRRNGFDLLGDPLGATLVGRVWVLGAQDVNLGLFTVNALDGAEGIGVYNGGHARLTDLTIQPDGLQVPRRGVEVGNNSMAAMNGVSVTGAEVGVNVYGSSYLRISSAVTIADNTNTGLRVSLASVARVSSASISGHSNKGIAVSKSSSVDMDSSAVTDNNQSVWVGGNSSFASQLNTISTTVDGALPLIVEGSSAVTLDGGNTLSAAGNDSWVINLERNSNLFAWGGTSAPGEVISNTGIGGGALYIATSSTAELRKFQLTGDISVRTNGGLKLRNRTGVPGATLITGNITIFQAGWIVAVLGPNDSTFVIDGNVTCLDNESSGSPGGAVTLTGVPSCTDFNR